VKANGVFSPQITQSLSYLGHGINVDTITDGSPTSYPPANLQQMRAMGITSIRAPVLVDSIIAGTPRNLGGVSTQADVDANLANLDGLVASFLNNGFSVTLCVFTTTGLEALPAKKADLFLIQANAALAARYGHVSPSQIFLEVLNEPHMSVGAWNKLAPLLVASARLNAPFNTIIVDAAWNAIPINLPFLVPILDANVIYNMHCYQPALLTTQGSLNPVDPNYLFPRPAGAKGPPGSEVSREWPAAKLAAYVLTGINWAKQRNLPLIMNEFGISTLGDPQSQINWLSFMRQIADDNTIPWAFWGYYHLFPVALEGQTPDYDPVAMQALGPNPTIINFGVNFTSQYLPFILAR